MRESTRKPYHDAIMFISIIAFLSICFYLSFHHVLAFRPNHEPSYQAKPPHPLKPVMGRRPLLLPIIPIIKKTSIFDEEHRHHIDLLNEFD